MFLKKLVAFIIFITFLQNAFAQQSNIYYLNDAEKPEEKQHAVKYLKVYKETTTDSNFKTELYDITSNKLLSSGQSKDELGQIKDGYFKFWTIDGKLSKSGSYKDGKADGEWLVMNAKGKVTTKYNYLKGKLVGSNLSWYDNKQPADSFMLDNSGNGNGIGYYEDGKKRYTGIFADGVKSGTWTYYYDLPGSTKSMEINFMADSIISSNCFTQTGAPQNICIYEREAEFIGGYTAWQKYLVSKLTDANFVKYVKHTGTYQVIVRFMVSKDGSISDISIESASDIGKLNKLALSIIEESPRWEPAIQYNQKINAYRRQPIIFAVE